jgi:nucleoside 2-deoxyribosyltransferase
MLLLALDRETTFVGERHDLEQARWWAASWCGDATETENLARLMQSMGWIEPVAASASAFSVMISARGWERLEKLRRRRAESDQGFVAMWFDDPMRRAYDNALAPAITDAGYQPHRVDRREFEGKIDDEIVAQIRRSRFVVAEFTGHRYGVYWEAGFAAGLGLPVFFTCRKEEMGKLHFDVRQYNCIDWETEDELRERLAKRIEAVIGQGPVVPAATR